MHASHGGQCARQQRTNATDWSAGAGPRIDTLVDEYRRDLEGRLRSLRGLVRTSLVENNALGLPYEPPRLQAEPLDETAVRAPLAAGKQQAFENWFQSALDEELLSPVGPRRVRRGDHYSAAYVRSSYGQGLNYANGRLRDANVDVGAVSLSAVGNAPIHRDALETLYRRNYRGLEAITDAADATISRTLAASFRDGVGPQKAASRLTGELETIQTTRARVLARTELQRAAHVASISRYQTQGVTKVDIVTTNPCPECQAIAADAPYQLDKARGLLPRHPSCRCAVAPIVT